MNRIFSDRDYSTDFVFYCPHCHNGIQCDVHQAPEFELSKAQTLEEYQEFLKKRFGEAQ